MTHSFVKPVPVQKTFNVLLMKQNFESFLNRRKAICLKNMKFERNNTKRERGQWRME